MPLEKLNFSLPIAQAQLMLNSILEPMKDKLDLVNELQRQANVQQQRAAETEAAQQAGLDKKVDAPILQAVKRKGGRPRKVRDEAKVIIPGEAALNGSGEPAGAA